MKKGMRSRKSILTKTLAILLAVVLAIGALPLTAMATEAQDVAEPSAPVESFPTATVTAEPVTEPSAEPSAEPTESEDVQPPPEPEATQSTEPEPRAEANALAVVEGEPAPISNGDPLGYVYVAVEKFTVGQGYIVEPVKVPFYAGENGAHVLVRALGGMQYSSTGSVESGFYLSGIKDDDTSAAKVPQYIIDAVEGDGGTIGGRGKQAWLSEFDYYFMAGWMYKINNEGLGFGVSDYEPQDGDVMRFQFSIYGFGLDVGMEGFGEPLGGTQNRDALTQKIAEINSALNRDELLADGAFLARYNAALTVLKNLEASQAQLDAALADFNGSGNKAPVRKAGVEATAFAEVGANEAYTLDLSTIFEDADKDALTYKVSVNGGAAAEANAAYTYTPAAAGTTTLVFSANDGKADSKDTYTVKLTATNVTYDEYTVNVGPSGVDVAFYVCAGFDENGSDILGAALKATDKGVVNGYRQYVLKAPENAKTVSFRGMDADKNSLGGMTFDLKKGTAVSLQQAELYVKNQVDGRYLSADECALYIKDADNQKVSAGSTYVDTTGYARARFLVYAGGNAELYSFYAEPTKEIAANYDLGPYIQMNQTFAASKSTTVKTLTLPATTDYRITAPTGATVRVWQQLRNFFQKEAETAGITDNADGTSTYNFKIAKSGGAYVYKVSMPGKITKGGYVDTKTLTETVTFDADENPQARPAYDRSTPIGARGEDSVLMNTNEQGYLELSGGESYKLRAYRAAWEIVNSDVGNIMIEPDFHYSIVSGDSVALAQDAHNSQWATITAKKPGITVIKVTYDAIDIKGGSYPGRYGAIDPLREGIVVVNVGGTSSGLEIDTGGWDAELDTVYFTGESGSFSFKATSGGAPVFVEVNGKAQKPVSAGSYAVPVGEGNNIVKISSGGSVDYQIVRGKKLKVNIENVTNPNEKLAVGDQAKISFDGLYQPVPKMSGIYNPRPQVQYQDANGKTVSGVSAMYTLVSNNAITLTIEQEGAYKLTGGRINVSGFFDANYGFTMHRTLGDEGIGANFSAVSKTRQCSTLPDILIQVGNRAPALKAGVGTAANANVSVGEAYTLDLSTIFEDADGDTLTYKVSVNGAAAVAAEKNYTYKPSAAGTTMLAFTANDAQADSADTYVVTLKATGMPDAYKKTGKYLYETVKNPVVASTGGEWAVIGLVRAGYPVDAGYGEKYITNVINTLKETNGVLDARKYTEYSRVVLALTSIGYDVTNVAGYDLLAPLADYDKVVWQGVNGPIWALIAFDSHSYDIPAAPEGKTQATRQNLIKTILDQEKSGGGWALSGAKADPDITGMAIQALAPYYEKNADVKAAVDRAIAKLSALQDAQGGFGSWGTMNCESCAQVIAALATMGIDPNTDPRFIKNGKSVVDALLSYELPTGGFKHTANGGADGMATEQAYYALVAYERMMNGKPTLYDMNDVKINDAYKTVIKLIDAIGTVTPGSGDAIRAARSAYAALSEPQKAQVGNYAKLTASESKYAEYAGRIASVKTLIDEIGTVTLQSEGAIKAARTAYDALSNEEKALVTNYAVLTMAERAYKNLISPPSEGGGENGSGSVQPQPSQPATPQPTASQPAEPQPEGGTKSLGSGQKQVTVDGINYRVSESAAPVVDKIAKMTKGAQYDLNEVVEAYKLYASLTAEQKAEIVNYADLEAQMNRVGVENHRDEATGVVIEGVDWNIKMDVKPVPAAGEVYRKLGENIGSSNALVALWEISLSDILANGAEYRPNGKVTVRVPAPDLSAYASVMVVHYTDDGRVEYIDCRVENGEVVWEAEGFSHYGLIGGAAESVLTLDEGADADPQPNAVPMAATGDAAQQGSMLWLWIVIACAGIAAIVLVILAKKGKLNFGGRK